MHSVKTGRLSLFTRDNAPTFGTPSYLTNSRRLKREGEGGVKFEEVMGIQAVFDTGEQRVIQSTFVKSTSFDARREMPRLSMIFTERASFERSPYFVLLSWLCFMKVLVTGSMLILSSSIFSGTIRCCVSFFASSGCCFKYRGRFFTSTSMTEDASTIIRRWTASMTTAAEVSP